MTTPLNASTSPAWSLRRSQPDTWAITSARSGIGASWSIAARALTRYGEPSKRVNFGSASEPLCVNPTRSRIERDLLAELDSWARTGRARELDPDPVTVEALPDVLRAREHVRVGRRDPGEGSPRRGARVRSARRRRGGSGTRCRRPASRAARSSPATGVVGGPPRRPAAAVRQAPCSNPPPRARTGRAPRPAPRHRRGRHRGCCRERRQSIRVG